MYRSFLTSFVIHCYVIFTHRIPKSIFAHYVEQVADGPDHNASLSTVSHHRVGFTAARRAVSEHGGVEADEYVFDQALGRFLVHLVLNEIINRPLKYNTECMSVRI